ncbi:class-III aminotransferase [Pyrenochaeta sp. DS3sAY3a]|nr:class-III aminotransferase [Pyrenochaeta sp. DS3sAY3a]
MMSSSIFHRSSNKTYPTATGGKGVYLHTSSGRRILDGSSGAAVSCLGHGHPILIEAIINQTRQLSFAHTSFFTSDPAEKLASLLIEQSDGAFSNVMFLSSGSEAVESALKVARQYHVCNGEPERVNIISRRFAYHGNTLGALAAGYNPSRRRNFEPLLSTSFHHASPCFFSRDAKANQSEDSYVDSLINEFEAEFSRLGPHTVAAVIVEPVGGATLGAVPAAKGYLARLKQICEKYGALLIFDEVMCGMGRVGTLHAWQSLGGTPPHIQTIGKGLAAGYQPMSAVLVTSKVYEIISASSSLNPFVSGHTYQGHSIGCAAALATQQLIIEEGLLKNVQLMGDLLVETLRENTPNLKEVRGQGLFIGVEFATVANQSIAGKVAAKCFENGAAVYLCSSEVDAVLFAPPFIINSAEIAELSSIFVASVASVLEDINGELNHQQTLTSLL